MGLSRSRARPAAPMHRSRARSMCAGADAVMTPVQAYSALRDEGYRVEYLRVPLTDGAAPRESIFDAFHQVCSRAYGTI